MNIIHKPDYNEIICVVDGEQVGRLGYTRMWDTEIYIGTIKVEDEHQGKGYGTALIECILKVFNSNPKLIRLYLVALTSPDKMKRLTGLYKSFGFKNNKHYTEMELFKKNHK